jgi:tRNA(fMet)-specific endonuclease VapC
VILDTNALSAFADGVESVRAPVERDVIAVPAIVLGEYRFGILQSRRRDHYERWLTRYLPAFRQLDVDAETARHYAAIRLELKTAGTPIPVNDLWIAALCRQHSLAILSRDGHFDLVKGLRRVGW